MGKAKGEDGEYDNLTELVYALVQLSPVQARSSLVGGSVAALALGRWLGDPSGVAEPDRIHPQPARTPLDLRGELWAVLASPW